MTQSGNISSHGGGGGGLVAPSGFFTQSAFTQSALDTTQSTGTQASNASSTYYTDTQSGGQKIQGKLASNYLNKIPAPNSQISGSSNNDTNPFLRANPLVAFFMNFDELSTILMQMSNAQEKVTLLEMSIVQDLGLGEAQQILNAATAEQKMYIAQAVSDFADMGSSLVQTIGSASASYKANKELSTEENRLKGNVDDAGDTVTTEEKNVQAAKQSLQDAENQLNQAQQDKAYYDSGKGKQETIDEDKMQANKSVQEARDNLKQQQATADAATDKLETAKDNQSKAQKELDKFKTNREQTKDRIISERTMVLQMSAQALTKGISASSKLYSATMTLEKGQAEALRTVMSTFLTTATKMIDSANSDIQANHKMVSDLMQALQQYSNNAKKLGGSLTATPG